jgi:hypothetical protein
MAHGHAYLLALYVCDSEGKVCSVQCCAPQYVGASASHASQILHPRQNGPGIHENNPLPTHAFLLILFVLEIAQLDSHRLEGLLLLLREEESPRPCEQVWLCCTRTLIPSSGPDTSDMITVREDTTG